MIVCVHVCVYVYVYGNSESIFRVVRFSLKRQYLTNEWVPDVLVCVITPHVRLDIQGSYIFFSPANRLARH